jgi:hypothetical protein
MRAIAVLVVALLASGCLSSPTIVTQTITYEKDPSGKITKIIETETVAQQIDTSKRLRVREVLMDDPPPRPPIPEFPTQR